MEISYEKSCATTYEEALTKGLELIDIKGIVGFCWIHFIIGGYIIENFLLDDTQPFDSINGTPFSRETNVNCIYRKKINNICLPL